MHPYLKNYYINDDETNFVLNIFCIQCNRKINSSDKIYCAYDKIFCGINCRTLYIKNKKL